MTALWTHHGKPSYSPTESLETYNKWSWRWVQILNLIHRTKPPTHAATIKFKYPITIPELADFRDRIATQLRKWSQRNDCELAVFYKLEIERDNVFHFHLLIRTPVENPYDILSQIIERSSDHVKPLSYLKPIQNAYAYTKYIFKSMKSVESGHRQVFLFKPHLGTRFCGKWNPYYDKPMRDLERKALRRHFLSGA